MATKRKKRPTKEEATRKAQDIVLAGWARNMLSKKEHEDRVTQIEQSAIDWYAMARSRLEEVQRVTEKMANRIEKEPGCILASIFDAEELHSFEGHLNDTISYLQNVYPRIGEKLPDPVEVMREVTAGHCATA